MSNKSFYISTILIIICIYVIIGCIIFALLSYNNFLAMLTNIYSIIKITCNSAHLYITQIIVNTLPIESTKELVRGLPDDTIDIVKCRQTEAGRLNKTNEPIGQQMLNLPNDDDIITQCKASEISAIDVPLQQAVQNYNPKIILY